MLEVPEIYLTDAPVLSSVGPLPDGCMQVG